MKWRNSKERELLASGGSRDQTLPNKNNPNPDLSDARNDRQPSMSPPSSPNPQSSPTAGSLVGIGLNAAAAPGNGSMSPRSDSYGVGSGDVHMKAAGSADGMGSSVGVGNGSGGSNGIMGQSKQEMFKYEFGEENRTAAGHMFNHFYDKLRDVNGIMAAGGLVGGNVNMNGGGRPTAMVVHSAASPSADASAAMSAYYDEYDSNSDSDEEISVT